MASKTSHKYRIVGVPHNGAKYFFAHWSDRTGEFGTAIFTGRPDLARYWEDRDEAVLEKDLIRTLIERKRMADLFVEAVAQIRKEIK